MTDPLSFPTKLNPTSLEVVFFIKLKLMKKHLPKDKYSRLVINFI